MSDTISKLTYQTFQQGKNYFGLAHKLISTRLMNLVSPVETNATPIPTNLLLKSQERLNKLLEVDWQF